MEQAMGEETILVFPLLRHQETHVIVDNDGEEEPLGTTTPASMDKYGPGQPFPVGLAAVPVRFGRVPG